MAKQIDEQAQIELMKWNVERWEVANLSLIDRASTLAGFSILEFGLIAQLLTSNLPQNLKLENLIKFATGTLLVALCCFLWSLRSKADGDIYSNVDLIGKTTGELIELMTYIDPPADEIWNQLSHTEKVQRTLRKIKRFFKKEVIQYGFNEEALQERENIRRSKAFSFGMIFLGISQLCLALALLHYFNIDATPQLAN